MKEIKGYGVTLLAIEKTDEKADRELGEIFVEMRKAVDLDVNVLARELGTSQQTVIALETGNIGDLPEWEELSRVVSNYTKALQLDPEPIMRRLALGISSRNKHNGDLAKEEEPPSQSVQVNEKKADASNEKKGKTLPANEDVYSLDDTSPKPPSGFLTSDDQNQNTGINQTHQSGDNFSKPAISPNLQKRLNELTGKPTSSGDTPLAPKKRPSIDLMGPKPAAPSMTGSNTPPRASKKPLIGPAPFPNVSQKNPTSNERDGKTQQDTLTSIDDHTSPQKKELPPNPDQTASMRDAGADAVAITKNPPLTADNRYGHESQGNRSLTSNLPVEITGLNPDLFQPHEKRKPGILSNLIYFLSILACLFLGWTYFNDPSSFKLVLEELVSYIGF